MGVCYDPWSLSDILLVLSLCISDIIGDDVYEMRQS